MKTAPVNLTTFDIFVQTRTCLLIRCNVFHLLTEEEETMDERPQHNVWTNLAAPRLQINVIAAVHPQSCLNKAAVGSNKPNRHLGYDAVIAERLRSLSNYPYFLSEWTCSMWWGEGGAHGGGGGYYIPFARAAPMARLHLKVCFTGFILISGIGEGRR